MGVRRGRIITLVITLLGSHHFHLDLRLDGLVKGGYETVTRQILRVNVLDRP